MPQLAPQAPTGCCWVLTYFLPFLCFENTSASSCTHDCEPSHKGRAWTKPYWQTRFTQAQIDRALILLEHEAEVVPITAHVTGIATHPEDDLVLATAVSAQVEYLATGDRVLQDVGVYQGVSIRSPRALLDLLL